MRQATVCCGLLLLGLAGVGCSPAPVQDRSHEMGPPWVRVDVAADVPRDRPLQAGFLILEGVFNTELTAPLDIFHHSPPHTDPQPGIEVFTVSPDGKPVTTYEDLRIDADYGFHDVPPIDILVVPSADGNMDRDLKDTALLQWVRETGSRAKFVVSLCDGAFVLAGAGLLDGQVATTFPGDQDRFAELFPNVDLRREPSFVHHGKFLTSQGGAKSFDVAMYLIDHLYGEAAAGRVGRGLIIAWPPSASDMVALVVPPTP